MILPLLLLVVGTLVVDHARPLAVSGFVVATLGFGLRSILLQVDLMERQASLDQLARQDGLTGVPTGASSTRCCWPSGTAHGAVAPSWACCCWISIISRPSTTATAIPPATAACRPWQRS